MIKVVGLMNIVTDVGLCYEKMVNEVIVSITAECNVESRKEYRMVYDRGKCVKFSP